jgi:flagellar basal-body rod protein FlgC
MNLFGMLEISGSGMTAERQRAQVVVSNMANAQTTRTTQGGPYQRQLVVFRTQRQPEFPRMWLASFSPELRVGRSGAEGVRVERVIADKKPPVLRYEPGNPEADAKGYVAYPVLLAIEQMLECKTAPCLATSTALGSVLSRMEEEARKPEQVFEGTRRAEEMTSITMSYAAKLSADQVRTVACGEFIWTRMSGEMGPANLLFSRRAAETIPSGKLLARTAG